jgi:hypothetical protein
MASMYSPNEPTFWLHHSNIDRHYHLWADCHGYDKVKSGSLTFAQYEPANPALVPDNPGPSGPPSPKLDKNGKPWPVGLQDKICYWWDYSSGPGYLSTTESKVFPQSKWPTIRQLWSLGVFADDPGHDGINYRYGPDALVALSSFKDNCPDKTWTYCNVPLPSKKRSDEADEINPVTQMLNEQYKLKLDSGKTSMEALKELAMEECEALPKPELDDDLKGWLKMSGGYLQDRICDKPHKTQHDSEKDGQMKDGETTRAETGAVISNGQDIPMWAVVVATVSALCVIIIVVVVVIFLKKRNITPKEKDAYVDLTNIN